MNQQRGVKRLCANCGTRYFDFMAKPVCPKCQAEFVIPPPAPLRRGSKANGYAFRPAPVAAEPETREDDRDNLHDAAGEEREEEAAELE